MVVLSYGVTLLRYLLAVTVLHGEGIFSCMVYVTVLGFIRSGRGIRVEGLLIAYDVKLLE